MTGSDRERDVAALRALLVALRYGSHTFTTHELAERILASDWLAAHDKAIADEAAADALAGHRCQVGGDGWGAARGRGSVGGDQ